MVLNGKEEIKKLSKDSNLQISVMSNNSNDWEDSFNTFIEELENKEQPSCNIENQEECDSCGS